MKHKQSRQTPTVLKQCQRLLASTYDLIPEPDPIDLFGMASHLYQELYDAKVKGRSLNSVAEREELPLEKLAKHAELSGFGLRDDNTGAIMVVAKTDT